ncbi:DOMON-like domain-containing protein [Blastomonas sp.]|uniref:DOMON-like domain-containing protein n=1 Tax=Blastomonas sp. TaxID=1909299 RepID=UPI003919CB34
MERHPLTPHPDFPPPAGVAVSVAWTMPEPDHLTIEYHVADPDGRILWPAPTVGRTDNLWQHTCFEAFVAPMGSSTYAEFNCSPSGGWAAYAFDGYRTGMRDVDLAAAMSIRRSEPGVQIATLDVIGLDEWVVGAAPWKLAVTAVIEAKDGAKSFWSLAHPPGKPDFHHADCFAARLG